MHNLNKGKLVLAPFKDIPENEEKLKERSKLDSIEDDALLTGSAKSLCFPLDEELKILNLNIENGKEMNCITNELTHQDNKTTQWCLFGRS